MTVPDELVQADRPTNVPTVACPTCGRWLRVMPDGRGFPPQIARRKLARLCGHSPDEMHYRAGIAPTRAPGLTVSFPFTAEQAQAVVVAADAFGVEPWEMASHLIQLRWQLRREDDEDDDS